MDRWTTVVKINLYHHKLNVHLAEAGTGKTIATYNARGIFQSHMQ